MLLEPSNKPVFAWEREARFNLKNYKQMLKPGGATKKLCKACARPPLPPPPHPPKPQHSPTLLSTRWMNTRKIRKSYKIHQNCKEMSKISSETVQKPCRSSPKRPNKLRTRQTSQKLPPKLPKFAKSLPKKVPRLPKGSKKTPKSSQKAPGKVPRNEA